MNAENSKQATSLFGHAQIPRLFDLRFGAGFVMVCMLVSSAIASDFFDKKPTELESRNTLRDLQSVREIPDVKIPRPDVFTDPPLIVEGTVAGVPEAKLYYFARFHTVDKLVALFNDQFLKPLYDNEGNPMPGVPYTIDQVPATHQLIVSCPSVEYAQQVLNFFVQVDVPPIQIKIDCIVSEIYADHTLDWQTNIDVENILGEKITMKGQGDGLAFPGAAIRDATRDSFGLEIGYVRNALIDGHRTQTLIDLLVSRGYLKILMNPSLEVVNGQKGKVEMTERVTLEEISISDRQGYIYKGKEYAKIIDRLEITPHVYADGYIGLETHALIGSKITPEGVSQQPIVASREITVEENRIRQGESMIIGGIRKAEQRSVVRGVPGLKDVPVLGILFSSKDFEERAKEILFILTPTISTGGLPNKDIVADVRRKHDPVKRSDLMENIKDPLGSGAYTELVEEEAIQAEVGRVRAEMEKAAADRQAEELAKKLAIAKRALEDEKKKSDRTVTAAGTDAETLKAAAQASKAEATEAKAKTEEIQKQLQAHKTTAAQATAEIEQAKTDLEKAQQAVRRARAEAAAAREAAEKAKADAEARIAEWLEAKEKAGSQGLVGPPPPVEAP